MSEFHYVRTRGPDGGVDACEGPAIGLDLETVLKDGLPPWKISLEIIAALCEILDIADEDGEIHGDVDPRYVFIDETGAVSLEGFGVKRRPTRLPEGTPRDTRADLYGLGLTAYRSVSSSALPHQLPDEPEPHDDLVIDLALAIDLSELDEAMQGDIQWFIAKLMSFDREDRPSALETWRTFVAFANELRGPDMADWCAQALDGGGERRVEHVAGTGPAAEPSAEDEDLGGPKVVQGFLSGKSVNFDDGGSSTKGGATAFWTKEDMKRALDHHKAEVTEDGPPAGVGGASATNFWSREQLAAMQKNAADAPRPKRADGEGERRKVTAAQNPNPSPRRDSAPGSAAPAATVPKPTTPPPAAKPPTAPPPAAPPPAAPRETSNRPQTPPPPPPWPGTGPVPRVTQPDTAPPPSVQPTGLHDLRPEVVQQRSSPPPPQAPPQQPPPPQQPQQRASTPQGAARRPTPMPIEQRSVPPPVVQAPPPAEEEGGGGLRFVLFGGSIAAIGGVVLVGLLIVLLIVVLIVSSSGGRTVTPVPVPLDPVPATPAPLPPVDPVPVPVTPTPQPTRPTPQPTRPTPQPTRPTPTPQPTRPTPTPTPTPRPTPTPTPTPTPRPTPTPTPTTQKPPPPPPEPGGSDYVNVRMRSSGRGTVRSCTDRSTVFDMNGTIQVAKYMLPVSCLVEIDGARGVFTVNGSGDIACDKQGTTVVCDKSAVP